MRSKLVLCSLFGLLFQSSVLASMREGSPLYLEVGEQRIISLPEIKRYSVSGDAVHYVRLSDGNGLLMKALKPGIATLFLTLSDVESETHLIRVEQRKTHAYPPALLQALNQIHQTEVIDGGDHFIFRGQVKNIKEAQAIGNLKERFPKFVNDETEIESIWFDRSKKELQKIIAAHPSLNLESGEGAFYIRGGLPNTSLKDAVIRKIKSIQPMTSIDIQTIKDADPTLYFKVFLLEVKKEMISSLGVEFPATHPASINLSTPQFLVSDSLDLTIHALSQKGLVRVLSSPELVVKAPGQAELFAGGELPIRQKSRFADSIIWKNVGLSLKLDVKEYSGEKVRLTVETEMSHLDLELKNDNIPGIQTNRIKTLVDGTLGKPLLLSGLLEENLHESSRGLPMLSKIPVIGKLFSSEDYQNNRSEFVAILLPHREVPAHPMARISKEIPKGFLPVSRNYLKQDEAESAKASKQYPWNVL